MRRSQRVQSKWWHIKITPQGTTFINVVLRRGFKASKQIVKLYYKMGKTEEMLKAYRYPEFLLRSQLPLSMLPRKNPNKEFVCRDMLTYTKSAVTRNASEKKINSLLDFVSASTDMKLLQVPASQALCHTACTELPIQASHLYNRLLCWSEGAQSEID